MTFRGGVALYEKCINFSVDNWMLVTVEDTGSAVMLRGCNAAFKFNFNSSNNLKNSRVSRYRFPLRQKMFELSRLKTCLWFYQAMYNVNLRWLEPYVERPAYLSPREVPECWGANLFPQLIGLCDILRELWQISKQVLWGAINSGQVA